MTTRRIVDLTLTMDRHMRGVDIRPVRILETDGWNTTTLSLYSHCGTHLDAPRHFLPGGRGVEDQELAVCLGPARVIDLTPVTPHQQIVPGDLQRAAGQVEPGDRLLLRTDWHQRYGTPEYRDALPRISLELAQWLVERRVALVGVEPPSVADVNNRQELIEVHQTLLGGNILVVEGLAHLDQLVSSVVEFIALPLKVRGGDGSPVRAIALEDA